jgi:hypothetical protein
MKFIGNYIDKIPPRMIDAILNDDGNRIPVYQPNKWKGTPEIEAALKLVEEAGYPALNYHFSQYDRNTPCLQPFIKDLDWLELPDLHHKKYDIFHWWVIKYLAGEMQPMHIDPHVRETSECLRYTLMLTDFVDGHVLTYNDFILTGYKAGDLFLWEDPNCFHGAVNVSYEPRISLQLSFYNNI